MPPQNADYGVWLKRRVVESYQPGVRGAGARAVAKQFGLSSHQLVLNWAKQFDGSDESLTKKHAGGRKRKLTHEESREHVEEFIAKRYRIGKAVSYADVHNEVKDAPVSDASLRTILRYGLKDHNITDKTTSRRLEIEGIDVLFPLSS